jgi:hypothetical protein
MKISGCLLTILLIVSVPAFAADHDITLFGGAQSPGKITLSNAASTGVTGATQILTDPRGVGIFGIRYGSGGLWGHEETFAYTPSFLDSSSQAVVMNSNLRIQAPTPTIKPYATVGLGAIISWGSGVSDIGSKFAVNYGGGVKFMPGPVGVRADVRGYVLPSVQSQTLNIAEVTLGVVFGW